MRILTARADRRAGRYMARALREEGYAVDTAATARGVLAACQGAVYAAFLLHADLGEGPQATPPVLELCRQLHARHPRTPQVLVHAHPPGAEQVAAARQAGVAVVLAEPVELADLRRCLQAQIRKSSHHHDAQVAGALAWADLELNPRTRCAQRARMEYPLTRREYALLELLLLRAPDTVSHAEIMAHVWGGDSNDGSNLIEVYMARLRNRLDRGRGQKLLHTVRGTGYRVGVAERA